MASTSTSTSTSTSPKAKAKAKAKAIPLHRKDDESSASHSKKVVNTNNSNSRNTNNTNNTNENVSTGNDRASDEDTNSTSSNTNIRVVVTGFGPFGGVEENPSNILIRDLPVFLQQDPSHHAKQKKKNKNTNTNTAATTTNEDGTTTYWKAQVHARVFEWMVIETSTQGVQESLEALHRRLQADGGSKTTTTTSAQTTTILLHLGVNVNGVGYQIEQSAYNEASFRIPDERGHQPDRVPIFYSDEGYVLGAPRNTPLDVTALVEHQMTVFPSVHTKVSTDPGRFVCNYLYYYSLRRFGDDDIATTDHDPDPDPDSSAAKTKSLFLHIPSFEIIPKAIQLEYVAELLRCLTEIELN